MKNQVVNYIKTAYGVDAEYLWIKTPDNAVFRNKRTNKWFGVIIGNLSKNKLGINSTETVNILNLKCDPIMNFSVVDKKLIFPGYHMNKEHWISVLLDGSVPMDELKFLIDMSYNIVNSNKSR